ncbi:enoyl-CoA hydratase/isomerase family protein [Mycobacterium sp. C31M]
MAELVAERHGATTVITINRPESMNSLTAAHRAEITEMVREFNADPSQLVAVVTGTGEKAFCAGADLKEMADQASTGRAVPMAQAPDFAGVGASEKPVIAAINGAAIAGGLELAICADIRVASTNAWFGTFEVKRGIVAGVAVNVLPRLIPIGAVMDLMLTGGRIGAEDAYRLGLVQQLVEPGELIDRALEKAAAIAANSGPAVWATKAIVNYWRDLQLAEQHRYYQAVTHRLLLSGEFLEGPRAFAEKREPNFSNAWPDPFDAR